MSHFVSIGSVSTMTDEMTADTSTCFETVKRDSSPPPTLSRSTSDDMMLEQKVSEHSVFTIARLLDSPR